MSRQDTVHTLNRIPVEFRTLSIQVQDREDLRVQQDPKSTRNAVKDLASLDWHKISTEEALQRLAVSPKSGLDNPQVTRRLTTYGKNLITPPKSNTLLKVLGWIFGGFGSLLLAASIVCFIAWKPLGEPNPQASNLALAVVLLVVIVIQAVFNAWQDFSTSRVMASIKDMLPAAVVVLRDGAQTSLPASELVPGDLVQLALGQKVPADLRLLEVSSDLKFDRSVLTGESEPITGKIDKTDDNFLETKNIALQGTLCVSGSGTGLVIQTGDSTVFGHIAKMSAATSSNLTTLQREILRFVVIIAGLATLVAILVVVLWAAWLRRDYPDYINVPTLLIDIVSVMVAFIPEGLPIAVTISLAKVAHTLSRHKVLCKRVLASILSLSIVETLGSVNVLCSDKTGTLTQNRMHVEDASVFDVVYTPDSLKAALESEKETSVIENLCQLSAVAAICNAATFQTETSAKGERLISGDATDSAILRFADKVAGATEIRTHWRTIYKQNFNSKTKYMLMLSEPTGAVPTAPVCAHDNFAAGDRLLCVKGAPEVLFPRCTHVVDPAGGRPLPLAVANKNRLVSVQERWAKLGRRVLVLARRIIPADALPKSVAADPDAFEEIVNELNGDLVVVGLVGLIDPLKPDIPETVRVVRGAGVRFFVVTGDHPATSVAIAAQAGIITNVDRVHTFDDLNVDGSVVKEEKEKEMSDDGSSAPLQSIVVTGPQLDLLTPVQEEKLYAYQEVVFARTTPEQKLRIVRSLQARDAVVAMTGDGVNDAPSLRAADCGIAMGSGSDVAREAADMVLLEDFSAIVIALEYGRLVFENLKKTILYLLPAGSFSELMPIVLNVLIGVPQMLSNIQMILICVATDVAPALSMCFEPPEHGLLSRPPRDVRKERLADWRLLMHAYGFLGVLESLCAMSMSFWYLQRHGVPFSSLALGFGNWPGLTNDLLYEAQSVYFFTLVLMQWGNLLATRTRKSSIVQLPPSWRVNKMVVPAAIVALVLGIFFHYVPVFHSIFQTSNIPVEYFFLPMTFGLGLLVLDELRKLVVRRYPKSPVARIAW
ncbi:sodium-potassium ATPase [Vararia minispora EC-137]|uniref:Sodium-potassium ATPase n=1 Tax=Vararia minispora EC-137 TaxID=1314806 RepID=A0ACB8QZA0_9AGAM|nr:sodium-potassium ATPase [Vararia minispora EC-137]